MTGGEDDDRSAELVNGVQSMSLDTDDARTHAINERNIAQMMRRIDGLPSENIKFLRLTYDLDWARTKRITTEAASRSNHVVLFSDWSDDGPPAQPVVVFFVRDARELFDADFYVSFVNDRLPPTNLVAPDSGEGPTLGTAHVVLHWVDEHSAFDAHGRADEFRRHYGSDKYYVSRRITSEKSIRWMAVIASSDLDSIPARPLIE
jgi:hypothetical protein